MKKYLLFLAVLFAAMTAKAYDVKYAGCYKSFKLEFQSTDEDNNPIKISELVTVPLEKDRETYREVGFFVISSMPFNTKEEKTSTGESPLDALILRTIATEGAVTVQIDGQGFGSSSGKTVPFLVNKVNARQSIDGLFAAMDYCKENGIKISDKYYTINGGFSLAGGRAIAIQRYLEKYSSAEEKSRFRLKQTICGGAPINAVETGKYILENNVGGSLNKFLSFFDGFCKANANGSLHAFSSADLFDADGNFRQDVIDGSSPVGRAFWKALAKENMDEDWIPETPIKEVHFTDDNIVTYKNVEVGLDKWGQKLQVVDREMSGMKWNLSMFRPVTEAIRQFVKTGSHYTAAANYYAGMIDGCLRDTVIANMYGGNTNYKDILTALFDITSGINQDIPVNISTTMNDATLTIKTLGHLHFTGDIKDTLGNAKVRIEATIEPEVLDKLHSNLTCVDANGYLKIPIDLDVTILNVKVLDNVPIHFHTDDFYNFFEHLTALVLHHKCTKEDDAAFYCDRFNETYNATVHLLGDDKSVYAWFYTESDSCFLIEPYVKIFGQDLRLTEWLPTLANVDLAKYLTIDNQKFSLAGYDIAFHVTEDNFGEVKFYADILKADSTLFGCVYFDVTGVNMNDDGSAQTLRIDFKVELNDYPVMLTGSCNNLNDAILAAILCYGNLSCETESEAQAYADAVNSKVQIEFYIAQVGDDGQYPEERTYIDYGPVKAVTAQDDLGAYYVQYCLNWMGKENLPLMTVIKELMK